MEFLTNTNEIEAWLKEMEIENYTIANGVVDVDGRVRITNNKLMRIPIQFGKVAGDFNCAYNKLTSLVGCPPHVGGAFYCAFNELVSLADCPTHVGEGFYCSKNKLTTLADCPAKIGGNFNCSYNQLTSLVGCPTYVDGAFTCSFNQLTTLAGGPTQVNGGFVCNNNIITSRVMSLILTGCSYLEADGHWADIIKKYLGRPDDIFECQAELIENGFEGFALL